MRLLTLVAALSLAFAAGCDRNANRTPSPKTDSQSSLPSAAAGSSTTSSGTTSSSEAKPSTEEKRNGGNPQQGQVDPAHADQHRDFQQNGDQAGPKSPDTAPTMKN
jgi:hypothetical protein